MNKFRLRLFVYAGILITLIGVLGFTCFNSWKLIHNNRKQKAELEAKYNKLMETEDKLEGEVVKLQDPEYVAKYAREKYLYTKEGELIIDLSKNEE